MKKFGLFILIILCIGGIFYFTVKDEKKDVFTPKKEIKKDIILEKLNQMSLDEKIGQMIFVAYRTPTYDDAFLERIKTYQPGGFILFKENATSYEDIINLKRNLEERVKIPLFFGVDQEGGIVQRLFKLEDYQISKIPSMAQVGLKNDLSLTNRLGRIMGEELRSFGINLDFAPSLDINSNPNNTVIGSRSFGENAEIVSSLGQGLAASLKKENIIPVYKHYPGHGDTNEDSHDGFSYIHKTLEELEQVELIPFKKASLEEDAMIMIGHLSLPQILEDDTPASLSKTMIDYLKKELGFKGVITSDALDMGALTKNYTEEEIILKGMEAGLDIFLMPKSLANTVEIIKEAIQNGSITEERINESVYKILKLKNHYHFFDEQAFTKLDTNKLVEHQTFIDENF